MFRFPTIAAMAGLAFLAACGTPQQQCLSRVSADLRSLESERADRQRSAERGYRLERRVTTVPVMRICRAPDGRSFACPDYATRWEDVPVRVNRRIEAQRVEVLDEVIQRERRLVGAAQAQCRVDFPES